MSGMTFSNTSFKENTCPYYTQFIYDLVILKSL